ncbi:enoyl-CoA hydratase-related protein [Vibrio cortegadensis]|uniref:Enoyl-CoA hydratase-related protein n=1 Tax=Vibrio cortegadensis TaxID=1328770 RepID=A0ABV4M468_9VIBR
MTSNQPPPFSDLLCDIDARGVATLTLNRVDKHNAFDDRLIDHLLAKLHELATHPSVRVLLLRANGKHFSAGADLNWMRSMAEKTSDENKQDATQLAHLMATLDNFPHPTIAVIQGSAFGGALGLICCCDIAIAQDDSQFCLSEVKLGLIPATIAPYLCRAIGTRLARRYMLTAESINAKTALHIGLVHKLACNRRNTEQKIKQFTQYILANSPTALQQAKTLCQRCATQPIDSDLIEHTSQLIADIRVSEQGQEGLNAFFEKRPPSWSAQPKKP